MNLLPRVGRPEERKEPRIATQLGGKIAFGDPSAAFNCVICNLSASGAMVELAVPTLLPREVLLLNMQQGLAYEATVVWNKGRQVGLSFLRKHDIRTSTDRRVRKLRSLLAPRQL